MIVMMMNGLLHCLLIMLTLAAIAPQSKLTAGLQMDGEENRVDVQVRSDTGCDEIGGQCVCTCQNCPSDLPITKSGNDLCSDRKKRCCYPGRCINPENCCKTEGCFYLYASSQCFCYMYNASGANWTEAREICTTQGHGHRPPQTWRLAHPDDAVALRSVLVQHCGDCGPFWLNAQYKSDDKMEWMNTYHPPKEIIDNRVKITPDNILFPSSTTSFPPGSCLELRVSYAAWKANPERPYAVAPCADKTTDIICERLN